MAPPSVGASKIVVAIDTTDAGRAEALARLLGPHVGLIKLGLEFILANGATGYRAAARQAGRPVFLDLKLHDIPNTVAGAVRAILPLRPRFLTLHAAGGAAMIAAAREAAEAAGTGRPLLLGVTVLTSIAAADLDATGIVGGPADQALRLGRLALAAGADGLVCSPLEIRPLRHALGAAPVLVVPGIRAAREPRDDQVRTKTPREALEDGADYLVIGRPITGAPDPAAAAAALGEALA